MSRSFSLSYLTAPVADPFEALTIAQGAGYAHLGLRLRDPLEGGAASPLVGSPPLRREMNRRLSDAGVTVIEIEAWMLLAGRPASPPAWPGRPAPTPASSATPPWEPAHPQGRSAAILSIPSSVSTES